MKRIAVTLVGLVAAVVIPLAPAHADKPVCYAVPDLPGECLSYETFVLIDDLQHQNRQLAALLDNAWTVALEAKEDATNTRALLVDMTVQRDEALAQRDAALATLTKREARILVLRARVVELRRALRVFA